MIKVMYIRKRDALLEPFLSRQIKNTDLSEVEFSSHFLDEDGLLEKYPVLRGYYNIVFLDMNNSVIDYICNPFSSSDLKSKISYCKKLILSGV